MSPSICVVVHDVAPATRTACERVFAAVREVAPVRLTLLAVPRYHCDPPSPEFGPWLLAHHEAGHEIALHGYTHQDDGRPRGVIDHLRRHVYTRGEGEFVDLTLPEATRRLIAGRRWFRRLGLPAQGFVAPAWLMGEATWEALRWLDFAYTCTLRHIVLLPDRQMLASQSIVYSSASAWRRQASLAWTRAVALHERHNPVLRLELHPHDADHAGIRRAWQRLLDAQLGRRIPRTLGAVAERWRLSTDWDRLGTQADEDDEGPPYDPAYADTLPPAIDWQDGMHETPWRPRREPAA